MSYSSILGAAKAPSIPSGRDADLLGPSDKSDSGSDALGTGELHGDSDSGGTGEGGDSSGYDPDREQAQDILPDQIVRVDSLETTGTMADDPAADMTDLDAADDSLPEDDLSEDNDR